jgi:peptidoglycan/LPS O-acetylase OafA/YrhL
MSAKRVAILDSFRFLAIMSVMLFHFAYLWSNVYPYGRFFGDTFAYGYYGVQFFFIISGFVICYTLENTSGMASFWKNRLIRLLPPMIVCSLITFLVFTAFDNNNFLPNSHEAKNFLPSLTFIHPGIWTMLVRQRVNFCYIDYGYWSLWVEVQFYIVASAIFFANPGAFFRKLIMLALVINALNWIPTGFMLDPAGYHLPHFLQISLPKIYFFTRMFDLKLYLNWFVIGAFFLRLFMKRKIKLLSLEGIGMSLLFINQFYCIDKWQLKVIYLVMLLLFCCMVYKESVLSFLDKPFLRRVGVLSYSIYLIHGPIGVLLIYKLGHYLGKWSPIMPLIVIFMAIGFGELSFRLYEKRASAFLKKILFKPKPAALPVDIPVSAG